MIEDSFAELQFTHPPPYLVIPNRRTGLRGIILNAGYSRWHRDAVCWRTFQILWKIDIALNIIPRIKITCKLFMWPLVNQWGRNPSGFCFNTAITPPFLLVIALAISLLTTQRKLIFSSWDPLGVSIGELAIWLHCNSTGSW